MNKIFLFLVLLNGFISAQWPRVPNLPEQDLFHLTNREKEVLRLIGNGLSNKEIAVALYITEGTVKSHVSNLLSKLGVRDRTKLALLAQKNNTKVR
jgi:DNA-binding NarL/FixJ family response regulator